MTTPNRVYANKIGFDAHATIDNMLTEYLPPPSADDISPLNLMIYIGVPVSLLIIGLIVVSVMCYLCFIIKRAIREGRPLFNIVQRQTPERGNKTHAYFSRLYNQHI